MKVSWKDYQYGSWLVVEFGRVDANVIVLGHNPNGVENHFGIITHPDSAAELPPGSMPGGLDPTRSDAKRRAETILNGLLTVRVVADTAALDLLSDGS